MTLVGFLLFALATVGASHILTESVIARPIRIVFATRAPSPLNELVYCARCTAFWMGAGIGAALELGVPQWTLYPFAAVGISRVLWGGLIEQEAALAADAESLRRQNDGRARESGDAPGDGSAAGAEDRDGAGDEKEAGAEAEEKAVRDADEARVDGDGEASKPCGCRAEFVPATTDRGHGWRHIGCAEHRGFPLVPHVGSPHCNCRGCLMRAGLSIFPEGA